MTLASILRAQLATGRPLRVTRALLEALDASETDSGDLAAYDRARAAERELADLDLVLPAACGSRVDAARELARERDEAYAEIRRLCDLAAEREEGHDIAIRERDEARRTMLAMRRQRDDYADRLDAAQSRADERDIMRRERDEARVEVERLRSLAAPVDCARLVREAEERGARWALDAADYEIRGSAKSRELRATAASQGSAVRARIEYGAEVAWSEAHRVAGMDAASICEAARKAGEHE